jgi:hypothetical protein
VQGEFEWIDAQLDERICDLYLERGYAEDEVDEYLDGFSHPSLKRSRICSTSMLGCLRSRPVTV